MKIEYKSSVMVPAGWRSVYITALAEPISDKRVRVAEVLSIDDEAPGVGMSRTGANRQRFNGITIAGREVGKMKNISALTVVDA